MVRAIVMVEPPRLLAPSQCSSPRRKRAARFTRASAFQIVAPEKTYTFYAADAAGKREWMARLNAVIDGIVQRMPALVDQRAYGSHVPVVAAAGGHCPADPTSWRWVWGVAWRTTAEH